jgi:hypothetical protein
MADGKNKIIFYRDWIEIFTALNDDEAGKLIKHFFKYVNDENPKPVDRITELSFIPLKAQLKRDLKKYNEYVESQRLNGSKGGRPRETQKTQAFSEKPKKGDKDKDKDKDKDIYRAFAHLFIYNEDVERQLDKGWTQEQIDNTLDAIYNFKGNTKYKDLNLLLQNWLRREHGTPKKQLATFDQSTSKHL